MRPDARANRAVIALANAIEATFDKGRWLELGLATDTDEVIRKHRRLLRSLDWGDDDYRGNIMDVLPSVLGARRGAALRGPAVQVFPNLRLVEEQVRLEPWLAANDPELHETLYAGEGAVDLDELEEAAE